MENTVQIVLWVDEDHQETSQRIDLTKGKVVQDQSSAREDCRSRGIQYRPLTDDLKGLVLFEKKGKDGQPSAVTLGDFGPFVLAKLENGVVSNAFSHHDLGKPIRLSRETLLALYEIFGGRARDSQ